MTDHKDAKAADERYSGNGWSDVERLVLYRLDVCEDNICGVKDDLAALVERRAKDVERSREQRTEQYDDLKKILDDIKETFADAALERAETEKLMCLKEQSLTEGQEKLKIKVEAGDTRLESRLSRIEKIFYGIIGTTGLYIIAKILDGAL